MNVILACLTLTALSSFAGSRVWPFESANFAFIHLVRRTSPEQRLGEKVRKKKVLAVVPVRQKSDSNNDNGTDCNSDSDSDSEQE